MTLAEDLPRTYEALRERLVVLRDDLPKRLVQVAEFALQNPDDIAFGTAASIAESADVQPSTLVRFAKAIGYSGFTELQAVFRERLRDRLTSYEDRLRALDALPLQASPEAQILNGFIAAAEHSVADLARSIDTAAFDRAVALLADAQTIFLVAKRRSFPLAAHMAYAFAKLGVRFQWVASPNGVDGEVAAQATRADAAIAVSFAPYAADSATHAKAIAEAGAAVVGITDSPLSPIAASAAVWFEVAEADYAGFRSLSASMALAMALPVAVAERRRKARQTME